MTKQVDIDPTWFTGLAEFLERQAEQNISVTLIVTPLTPGLIPAVASDMCATHLAELLRKLADTLDAGPVNASDDDSIEEAAREWRNTDKGLN